MVGEVPLDQYWRPQYEQARQRLETGDAEQAVETFRTMAAAGLPRGLYELGKAYRDGRGVERDPLKAAALLEQAASLPSDQQPFAAYHLARMYQEGDGVRRDPKRARQLFEQSLRSGYDQAASSLGLMMVEGQGGPRAVDDGRLLLERAAAGGDVDAHLVLAETFGSHRHARAAVDILEARLADGDVEAGQRLWQLRQDDRWPLNDGDAALAALRRTAELDHPPALAALGERHIEEAVTEQDAARGLALLRRAAEHGEVDAMHTLGRALLEGGKIEPRPGEAVRWLQAAAERGHPHAHAALGTAYLDGRGVRSDHDLAIAHLSEASVAGLDYAAAALGQALLESGRQPARGMMLLETAAAAGDRTAMMTLGRAHRDGQTVARDPEQSLAWFRRAERAGHPDASDALAGLLFDVGRERRSAALLREAAGRGHGGAMMELADLELASVKQGDAPDDAIGWLKKAARQGHPGADRALGRLLLATARTADEPTAAAQTTSGDRPRAQSARVRGLLQAASEAGSARASVELAEFLLSHPRNAEDRAQGVALLEAAAEEGSASAMTELAEAHLDGQHPDPDIDAATRWLERAADAGYVHAMAKLGDLYLSGRAGTDRDAAKQAEDWLQAAADGGSASAAA
ncbi:MAG: hypothetical protein R3349_02975, partial [Geminicoccaceae bacterium]|nr:hypothetical protein [Geminicoccaceae bacterium]